MRLPLFRSASLDPLHNNYEVDSLDEEKAGKSLTPALLSLFALNPEKESKLARIINNYHESSRLVNKWFLLKELCINSNDEEEVIRMLKFKRSLMGREVLFTARFSRESGFITDRLRCIYKVRNSENPVELN